MTQGEKDQLYSDTVEVWGERAQLEMLQEESTELALATRKVIRDPDIPQLRDLASEIADVEIMLEQVKKIYPALQMEIDSEKERKLTRLRTRVDNKQFEDAKS